jgi:hypothetical protein
VALLQSPQGARMLLGSGPGSNRLSAALGRRLPFDHRLDSLLITGCESEDLASLPVVLARIPLSEAWWACQPDDERASRALSKLLVEQSIPSQVLHPRQQLGIGGVTVDVLAARPQSAATRLVWGDLRVLLPAGLSPGGLGARAQQPGLLLLDEEDLDTATPKEWEALAAQVVIVAASAELHTGLPERWVVVLPDGWVEIVSDGEKMWVEVGN